MKFLHFISTNFFIFFREETTIRVVLTKCITHWLKKAGDFETVLTDHNQIGLPTAGQAYEHCSHPCFDLFATMSFGLSTTMPAFLLGFFLLAKDEGTVTVTATR